MDLSKTIIAKSDQLNADDLIGGPQTFSVVEVREGSSEQPVNIVFAELPEGKTFKPCKTVRAILVAGLGKETDDWPNGVRMTLFRDAGAKWAGEEVGGIRVSHLSHIKGDLKVALKESQKKKVLWTVKPLPDVAPEPTPEELAEQLVTALADATTEAEVREWGNRAHRRNLLDVEVSGETVRNHVTHRLAELADDTLPTPAADEPTAS